MKNEFVIWGIEPNGNEEKVLLSEKYGLKSFDEAQKAAKALENKYGCKNTRIQVIDFNMPFDFAKTALGK